MSNGNLPKKIRPATVRNRILWVLGQHGIELSTAQSIYDSLTSGNDPRPEHLPPSFTFQGVTLHWPSGVGTRLITPHERKTFNQALTINNNDLLDSEDNALAARAAYNALWHKSRILMDELVQEACTDTDGDGCAERLLVEIFTGTVDDLTDRAQTLMQLDGVLCGHKKPGGRLLCMEDNHHAGLHHNGKHSWTEDAVVVEHHAPKATTVTATAKRRRKTTVREGVLYNNLHGVSINGGPGLTPAQVAEQKNLDNPLAELEALVKANAAALAKL
jgi:hypothetical protein